MRIVVDLDVCEANAICMGLAPDYFEVGEDDHLYLLDDQPPEKLRPLMEQVVRACPKRAVSIEG